MKRINYLRPAALAIALLLIPFVGNLTVEGWDWGVFDFVIMFVLLYGAGLIYEFLARKTTNPMHRVGISGFVILGTLAVWSELAVDAVSRMLSMLLV